MCIVEPYGINNLPLENGAIKIELMKRFYFLSILTSFILLGLTPELEAQTIHYVKAGGTGNGSSWANASGDLQATFNTSAADDEVWVATGTYKPGLDPFGNSNPADTRDKTFFIKDGLKVYGGFRGTENSIEERDLITNISTLSGDIDNDNTLENNAYHVVLAVAPAIDGKGILLDGFHITGGNANGESAPVVNGEIIFRFAGGGIFTSRGINILENNNLDGNWGIWGGGIYATNGINSISNNILSENAASQGGGIYTFLGTHTLKNNSFSANSATFQGGGFYTRSGTNVLLNNKLLGNSAEYGGGIFLYVSTNNLTNNIISGNSATIRGGGIGTFAGTNSLINNSLSGNTANEAGAIFSESAVNFTITNNIIWGNSSGILSPFISPVVSYSIVQGDGVYPGTGNLNVDPQFVEQPTIALGTMGNLRLKVGSPAIDAGIVIGTLDTDLDGNTRPAGSWYDMGAYEFPCPVGNIIYVNAGATGNNTGISWADAFTDLQSALSSTCSGFTEIWVAKGTYKPSKDPFGNSNPVDARDKTFYIKDGLKLYGGFAGTETRIGDRQITDNISILNGDINNDGIDMGNSFHVVLAVAPGIDGKGILIDGFTIIGGVARGFDSGITVNGINILHSDGGGIYVYGGNNVISNTSFTGNLSTNVGGGIYLRSGTNTLTNNSLSDNFAFNKGGGIYTNWSTNNLINNRLFGNASYQGGGIYIERGINTFTNNVLSGNYASSQGGAIYSDFGSNTFWNNILSGNLATSNGGGILIAGGSNHLTNNSLSGNSAGEGGAILIDRPSQSILTNNIIWGNSSGIFALFDFITTTVNYSIVQGENVYPGTGNHNMDPLFVNQPPIGRGTTGDLRLQACSPAIDAGSNAIIPTSITTDVKGDPRIVNATGLAIATADMGAHEHQTSITSPNLICPDDLIIEGCGTSEITSTNTGFGLSIQNTVTTAAAFIAAGGEIQNSDCIASISYQDAIVTPGGTNPQVKAIVNRTFTAIDSRGKQFTCIQIITVKDRTDPTISNFPANITVACATFVPVADITSVTASDNCGTAIVTHEGDIVSSQTCTNRYTITRTYKATDLAGNNITRTQTITVFDNIAPAITAVSVSHSMLWPANHKMRDVQLNYTASDNCGGTPTTTVSITSNEDISGTGDGNTDPDWEIVNNNLIRLRAERAGNGDGRVYYITITSKDECGNSSSVTKEVRVAHNITAPVSGRAFKIGSTVNFAGTFWDVAGSKHSARWVIDGNTTINGKVTSEPVGSKNGTASGSYRFNSAGVYKLRMEITDQQGTVSYADANGPLDAIIVIYDPNGGNTYGGGSFKSEAGHLPSMPAAKGLVSYGFQNNYFKTATNPKGETQFEFKVGDFEYNALNFEYLAVSGAKAVFKGSGRITNNQSGINFMMTVIDGKIDGSSADKIRMKIYNKNTGEVYYDNQPGAGDDEDPVTVVTNNSTIVIESPDADTGVSDSGGGSKPGGKPNRNQGALGTSLEELSFEISASPNPSEHYFNLAIKTSNTKDQIRMQVMDAVGRVVEQKGNLTAGQVIQFGHAYHAGMYFITVQQGSEKKTLKLVKQ